MFMAIPVGQGDAFLLQNDGGRSVLVDGGRSRNAFPGQLSKAFAGSEIDVVVCTHADADHVDGLIGLLESAEKPVREVWLPGRWTARLEELLRNDVSWMKELAEDIDKTEKTSLESIGEEEVGEKDFVDGAVQVPRLDELLDDETAVGVIPAEDPIWLWPWAFRQPEKQKLWIEAIKTAERIRSLAVAAHHQGAVIRWFDFDEARVHGPGGGEAFLRPLNSLELAPGHALRKLRLLRLLALSVANRESLVFYAPESTNSSGVIFTADSDMACSTALPSFARDVVVTAPHHGSEANGGAYAHVSAALAGAKPMWVRSDGNFKKRPGASFLKQAQSQRACTLCRGSPSPKKAVLINDGPHGWSLQSGTCVCK